MALSGKEKETIILFNEAGGEASVYTYNDRLGRKLEELSQFAPEQVRLKAADDTGAVTYAIPKALISIFMAGALSPHARQRAPHVGLFAGRGGNPGPRQHRRAPFGPRGPRVTMAGF